MKTGFDLSSHQGAVHWRRVEADFAMVRVGWSWYEGGMNIDQRFLENVAGAQAAGIPTPPTSTPTTKPPRPR